MRCVKGTFRLAGCEAELFLRLLLTKVPQDKDIKFKKNTALAFVLCILLYFLVLWRFCQK